MKNFFNKNKDYIKFITIVFGPLVIVSWLAEFVISDYTAIVIISFIPYWYVLSLYEESLKKRKRLNKYVKYLKYRGKER